MQEYKILSHYFGTQIFFHPNDRVASYQAAAQIFFDCRRRGITIRSTIDCLITQIAIEQDLVLLHNDKDFEKMAGVVKKLNLMPV